MRGFSPVDAPSAVVTNTCIKCGLCLPTCPTYQLTLDERSSPRGRINLINEVLENRLDAGDPTLRAQMSECLGCRNCETVCPSGVAFGQLLEDARAQIASADRHTLVGALARIAYDAPLFDLRRLRALARLIRFADLSGLRALVRSSGVLERIGLARLDSLLASPDGMPLRADGSVTPASGPNARGSAALFVGCVMGAFFGDVQRATIRVLTVRGWDVEVTAGQGCCGALHLHAGYKDAARALARRTIAAFEGSDARAIAVNAAGCGAAMKEYPHLLSGDPDWSKRAIAFARRVSDVTELIDPGESARADPGPHPLRVAYQEACHLVHAQRVSQQPRRAIEAIPGVVRVEIAESDRCCGSAGVYNVTHPAMADELASRKIAAAKAASADLIVTENPGCHMHLAAASRRCGGPPVMHVISLIDRIDGPAPAAAMRSPRARQRPDERRATRDLSKGLLLAAGAVVIGMLAFALTRRDR
jgi:glycolate oxidase iron-sulfur subunit